MDRKIVTSGKRKSAVARAMIEEGNTKITINKKDIGQLELIDKLRILEPVKITEAVLGKINFGVKINVRGGGVKGQIEAARLALAKAILKYFKDDKKLQESFVAYDRNLLIADVRRKEAYKPGDSKARSKRQSSKR